MKLKEILERKNKKAKVLAQEIGTDEPMISKFVNYKCLPTPVAMDNICKALDCGVQDIYEDKEVFYKKTKKASQSGSKNGEYTCYNLSVRLPREACKYLKKENLHNVGYRNITDWIWACYRDLIKKSKEKDRSTNSESENGQAK